MDDQPYQQVYFIGIALPPELDRAITELKWQLHDQRPHMLKPLLPHVTLLHPPSLHGIMPSELLPRVHEVAKRYLPFTIALQEIGFFGDTVGYIRAQSLPLMSLQEQLVKLLPPAAQAQHYKRPYLPHVTIAQIYEPHHLDTKAVTEATAKLNLPQQFTVESVSYFKRILPREYRAKSV